MLTARQLARLHEAVSAVCPVQGFAGAPGSAEADYAPAATQAQRAAAAVLASFDWSAEAQAAWEEDQRPRRKALRQVAEAAVEGNDAFLALASPTSAQVLAQVRALTRQNTRIIQRLVEVE